MPNQHTRPGLHYNIKGSPDPMFLKADENSTCHLQVHMTLNLLLKLSDIFVEVIPPKRRVEVSEMNSVNFIEKENPDSIKGDCDIKKKDVSGFLLKKKKKPDASGFGDYIDLLTKEKTLVFTFFFQTHVDTSF